MKKRYLRSGYTTGACSAASAKAAAQLLINAKSAGSCKSSFQIKSTTITLPIGEKAIFTINKNGLIFNEPNLIATASTIKDAGDDPDVTNGAEIIAEVTVNPEYLKFPTVPVARLPNIGDINKSLKNIEIQGGRGVGIVTKKGLPVQVGFPAINPVPKRMIKESVIEAFVDNGYRMDEIPDLTVTISVPDGEKIAAKTLNSRLGIIGGISILGTTGIVNPLSSEAWTATITASMDVARASGCENIVLSTGRTSERAHMKRYGFPEEAYVMIGDYIEFSLIEAKKREFKEIHLATQWAKMLKIAMLTPQTHVRYGAIDLLKVLEFLKEKGIKFSKEDKFNTAREIFQYLQSTSQNDKAFIEVCRSAKKYSEGITGSIPVSCLLVSYDSEVICSK